MKKIGLIILVVGLLITLFTGFNLVTRKKVVEIGDLQITTNQNHEVAWSPVIGVAVMIIGGGVYYMERRKI